MSSIRVVASGATGKTGAAVTRALMEADGIEVVGAVARRSGGSNLEAYLGLKGPSRVVIEDDLEGVLQRTRPDVLVDFTSPQVAARHALTALDQGVAVVMGTTGLSSDDMAAIARSAERQDRAALVIPNFALGALLLFRFARQAAKLFEHVELIELHHAAKLDAPSGTALRLGETVARELGRDAIPIHSVRLPGFVAHHELIFGTDGERLVLRHDTVSRDAFGPGVVLAVRRVQNLAGLVTDLETLFGEEFPDV